MQLNEIKQRVSDVTQSVDAVIQQARNEQQAPAALKQCLEQLNRQSQKAQQIAERAKDESQLRQAIDELEQECDRAKEVCQESDGVSEEIRQAVQQAHDEVSELKHQLH